MLFGSAHAYTKTLLASVPQPHQKQDEP